MYLYIYILYDHSSSDKEIDGRGPGRGEKANKESFEGDGSMPRRAILFHHHLVVVFCSTFKTSFPEGMSEQTVVFVLACIQAFEPSMSERTVAFCCGSCFALPSKHHPPKA